MFQAAAAYCCILQGGASGRVQTATAVVVTLQPEAGAATTGSRAQVVAVVSGPPRGDSPNGTVQFTATPTVGGEQPGAFSLEGHIRPAKVLPSTSRDQLQTPGAYCTYEFARYLLPACTG